jgi:hypothetical protein
MTSHLIGWYGERHTINTMSFGCVCLAWVAESEADAAPAVRLANPGQPPTIRWHRYSSSTRSAQLSRM